MNKIFRYLIVIFAVFGLCHIYKGEVVYASIYQYGFSVDPPINRLIVKPSFTNIGTEFTVSNKKDPVYVQILPKADSNFLINIYSIDSDTIQVINPKNNTFLMQSKSSKRFRVEVLPNNSSSLELKDYTIDIGIALKIVQTPKNIQRPLILEPNIHKYVILSVTDDGDMDLDPKIALFQNVNGPVSLLNSPQNVVLTVQNRSNYMLSVEGTLNLVNPKRVEQEYNIPITYIFANSQKNLSIDAQGDDTLISLPIQGAGSGQYTASVRLKLPGTNTPELYGRTDFILVSPYYVVAIIAFCLIIIITIFFVTVRHT
jgi:hypothetical protein